MVSTIIVDWRHAFEPVIPNFRLDPLNLVLNSIFYHIMLTFVLFQVVVIVVTSIRRNRGLKRNIFTQRLLVHVILALSMIMRLCWLHYISLTLFVLPVDLAIELSNLGNRISLLLMFVAFTFNVALYARSNIRTLNPTRRRIIIGIIMAYCYGSTILIFVTQLCITLFYVLSPRIPTDGDILYDLNLLILLAYWLLVSIIFTWASTLYSIRLALAVLKSQVSARRKAAVIVQKALFSWSKILLFDGSMALRMYSFSYRPLFNSYMPTWVYPFIFYTLPDAMLIVGLMINFRDNSRRAGKKRRPGRSRAAAQESPRKARDPNAIWPDYPAEASAIEGEGGVADETVTYDNPLVMAGDTPVFAMA
ncbi:hypothetical protein J8273_8092 [Carpediemonas membranifera]|uniref:Uncharacterized protein n=1 Tax=Carpediemonas membranifera TaxID=201153 RepID=A0A8J6E6Y0_9EUKA|nr:hypothetical protein J8273_8092 [Carpediemonas membranifera]|eukprot:KAG9390055.1 hypothetical protein J8273_8092 [Carpediemonas membranifera]